MNVSNEQLSAFLDGELPEAEMQYVREAIAIDISLADKLAALAEVDVIVKSAAEKATATALPKSVLMLLEQEAGLSTGDLNDTDQSENLSDRKEKSNKVLAFSVQRKRRKWYVPLAAAASFAALAGLVFVQQDRTVTPGTSLLASQWDRVSSVLDLKLTGESVELASGLEVTPQLSFISTESTYCRQAKVVTSNEKNTLIACRNTQSEWQLVASSLQATDQNTGPYQTASKADVFNDEINKLMSASPLNRVQEQRAIESQWQLKKPARGVNNEN